MKLLFILLLLFSFVFATTKITQDYGLINSIKNKENNKLQNILSTLDKEQLNDELILNIVYYTSKYGDEKTVKIVDNKGIDLTSTYHHSYFKNYDAFTFAIDNNNIPMASYLLKKYKYDLNKTFKQRYKTSYLTMIERFYKGDDGIKLFKYIFNNIDEKIIKQDGKKLFKKILYNKEIVKFVNKNKSFKKIFDENIYAMIFRKYCYIYDRENYSYDNLQIDIDHARENIALFESYVKDDDFQTRLQKIKKLDDSLFFLIKAKHTYAKLKKDPTHKQYYYENLKNYLFVVASYNGDIEMMQELLDNGTDINFLQNLSKEDLRVLYPINPLLAAAKSHAYKSVKFLLKNGAKIDTKDWYKQTALVYALDKATQKDRKLIALLLESGVDIDLQFDEYRLALSPIYFRPLSFALVFTKDLEIVKMVSKRADLEILTGQDDTHITKWLSRFHNKGFLFSCERFKVALDFTADKNNISYHKKSILTYIFAKYNDYNNPFTKECSRLNVLNIFLVKDKDAKLTLSEVKKLKVDEKQRVYEYVQKRDYPTELLKHKKFDELYTYIKNTKDITTLAKTKTDSFLYDLLNAFVSKVDVMGRYDFLLYTMGKKPISKKTLQKLELNKKLIKIVKLLIDKGADVNQNGSLFTRRSSFSKALESVALYSDFHEIILYMIKHNADLTKRYESYKVKAYTNVITYLIRYDKRKLFEKLLNDKKIDISVKDSKGANFLDHSVLLKKPYFIKRFQELGLQPSDELLN